MKENDISVLQIVHYCVVDGLRIGRLLIMRIKCPEDDRKASGLCQNGIVVGTSGRSQESRIASCEGTDHGIRFLDLRVYHFRLESADLLLIPGVVADLHSEIVGADDLVGCVLKSASREEESGFYIMLLEGCEQIGRVAAGAILERERDDRDTGCGL